MTDDHRAECFISVDIETAGPIPGEFSLLSIGACTVISAIENDYASKVFSDSRFYLTLKPISQRFDPDALSITGFSLDDLMDTGESPEDAMRQFAGWIDKVAEGSTPVFVGLNAPFDWSFVNYYFHRFIGNNPFGFAALDIKSLFMGWAGGSWRDTRSSQMHKRFPGLPTGNHNALEDAVAQAKLFHEIYKNLR